MVSLFPIVPGWDVAGVVEAVGVDVPEYAPGDEVIGYVRKDFVQGGTYAEFVSAPVRTLARKPTELDWNHAAGLPLAGLTAYQVLNRHAAGRDDEEHPGPRRRKESPSRSVADRDRTSARRMSA